MNKFRILKLSLLLISSFLCFWGCAPKKEIVRTELDQLFEKNFEDFVTPDINKIKLEGKSKSFPYVTFDEVWHSAIIVLMQHGIIARAFKDTGVIVTITTPPLVLFIEKGEVVTGYLHIMDYLYKRIDEPEKVALRFSIQKKEEICDSFFDRLSTQIYSSQKWKYLYKGALND